jgi:hypothetical protein
MFHQNFRSIKGHMWAVYLYKVVVTKVYIKKTSKQIFEVKQIQLGGTWRKEFENWEAQIHYQDLYTKVWYVIMYLIPYKILYKIRTYV